MNKRERLALFEAVDIYPVTCMELSEGRSDIEFLECIIAGGAKIVQLREKKITKKELFSLARDFKKRCDEAGVLLIINDHLDVALALDADGVHLGRDDFPIEEARLLAPEIIIGASTHSRDQALDAAQKGADYFNIGPIYPTKTKEHASDILGPDAIPVFSEGLKIPFTVMGGIKKENLGPVIEVGARKIAVVTAITKAPDMESATRGLIEAIRNSPGKTV